MVFAPATPWALAVGLLLFSCGIPVEKNGLFHTAHVDENIQRLVSILLGRRLDGGFV